MAVVDCLLPWRLWTVAFRMMSLLGYTPAVRRTDSFGIFSIPQSPATCQRTHSFYSVLTRCQNNPENWKGFGKPSPVQKACFTDVDVKKLGQMQLSAWLICVCLFLTVAVPAPRMKHSGSAVCLIFPRSVSSASCKAISWNEDHIPVI